MIQRQQVRLEPAIAVVMLLALLLMQGCASTGSCLFGGATDQAQGQCQKTRWGTQGYLATVNAAALRQLPESGSAPSCEAHVALVERALAGSDYTTHRIRSCPSETASGSNCHVSLEVSDAAGARYVMDDGAMLDTASFVSGVGTFEEFEKRRARFSWEDHGRRPQLLRADADHLQRETPGSQGY